MGSKRNMRVKLANERNAEIEKRKVLDTTKKALFYLKAAKADLDSAFRWGVIDIVGGVYIVSTVKHLKVESAKKNLREAMFWLQQLRNKNDTTDYVNQKYMHLGPLGMGLDIGLDGIGPDIYAQTRIAGLRSRVKEAIRRVEAILAQVDH
ncbi:MAG: hypothetical protein II477_12515 [Lachnospiraceae bacterium]|nr:hypothetical protein [Lachnospiraceae bacterium]MBQ2101872.1 hypothetical protein [Lachnospiraceae bacterium]MBQ3906130.1 hypothetical protein [Lachnospiraceae bacterium]